MSSLPDQPTMNVGSPLCHRPTSLCCTYPPCTSTCHRTASSSDWGKFAGVSDRLAVVNQERRAPGCKVRQISRRCLALGRRQRRTEVSHRVEVQNCNQLRRAPGESLHRTAADQICTQARNLPGKRNVLLVIVAVKGGGFRRCVVEN